MTRPVGARRRLAQKQAKTARKPTQATVGARHERAQKRAPATKTTRVIPTPVRPRTLQDLVFALQTYWGARGCLIHQPWDGEVGAGTMHPETFLRVLGPKPWKVGYVQPSRRPADGAK